MSELEIPVLVDPLPAQEEKKPRKRGRPSIAKDGMRQCADCKTQKSVDDFAIKTVHGMRYSSSYCSDCEKQRDYVRRIRKRLLERR